MIEAVASTDPAAGVGILAALAAGIVSFLSPCVLPLVPGYLSAVTGVVVMLIGYWRVHGWFVGSQLNGDTTQGISMWALGLILVVGGVALGAAGSGLTMRRFLRV